MQEMINKKKKEGERGKAHIFGVHFNNKFIVNGKHVTRLYDISIIDLSVFLYEGNFKTFGTFSHYNVSLIGVKSCVE